jgi:hypothetical protein
VPAFVRTLLYLVYAVVKGRLRSLPSIHPDRRDLETASAISANHFPPVMSFSCGTIFHKSTLTSFNARNIAIPALVIV